MEKENKYLHRGLGCPQQAKRAAGGGAVIGISVKDIPIHCLPKRYVCSCTIFVGILALIEV